MHVECIAAVSIPLPKPGQRIACVSMVGDPHPIPSGERGTVLSVQHLHSFGEHHIHVAWDNGRTLTLISTVDKWENLSNE